MKVQLVGALVAVALAVSACSQAPAEVQGGLEPQFGGTGFSAATDVALDRADGGVYVVGVTEAPSQGQGGSAAFVTRFDRNGFQRSVRNFGSASTDRAVATGADRAGNVYVLWWEIDFSDNSYRHYLRKHSRAGTFVWQKVVSDDGEWGVADLALDPAGNVVVTGTTGRGEQARSFVRKYNPTGGLVWQGTPASGTPESVVVADDGSVYVAGLSPRFDSNKLSKFSAAGKVRWTRDLGPGNFAELATYGTDTVYTAANIEREDNGSSSIVGFDIVASSYSGGGARRWTRTTSLGANSALGGLTVSENGTLFVAGSVVQGEGQPDDIESGLVRKYSRNGAVIFTKMFEVSPDATFTRAEKITALNGGELYLVGVSGGERLNEAFIRRIDGRGNEVWTY